MGKQTLYSKAFPSLLEIPPYNINFNIYNFYNMSSLVLFFSCFFFMVGDGSTISWYSLNFFFQIWIWCSIWVSQWWDIKATSCSYQKKSPYKSQHANILTKLEVSMTFWWQWSLCYLFIYLFIISCNHDTQASLHVQASGDWDLRPSWCQCSLTFQWCWVFNTIYCPGHKKSLKWNSLKCSHSVQCTVASIKGLSYSGLWYCAVW